MKNNILYLFCLISLTLFTDCKSWKKHEIPLNKSKPIDNSTYTVEYLFEHDGCKVYRFRDDGNYVYFTSCKGETTSVLSDSTGTKYIKSKNTRQ